MEQNYWLKRRRAALGMALGAEAADTRLIHYDLAERYGMMAAQNVGVPADERGAALQLPARIGGTQEGAR